MPQRFIAYAGLRKTVIGSSLDGHLERLEELGYTILPDVLSGSECRELAGRMDALAEEQLKRFGLERLRSLNEYGVLRGLFAEDAGFLKLVTHPAVWEVVAAIVGDTAILHLQNGIYVDPSADHHQAAFHRDFAKDFVADRVLSLNALWVIDSFTVETGATELVPRTHRSSVVPSEAFLEENCVPVCAPAGSVVLFDSLLIHRAGTNRSAHRRRAINHQYTRPFIKQQMDAVALMSGRIDVESKLGQVLGFWSVPPKSVEEFRCDPDKRTYRAGQG